MILPETSKRGAIRLAERIRASLESGGLPVVDDSGMLTISVGVASYPADGETAEKLMLEADRAMYEAKHGGRNRVVDVATV